MRRLVYLIVIVALLGLVGTSVRIALQAAERERREEQARARLLDWHRQIALELHPSEQERWASSAERSPAKLLRCCTGERPMSDAEISEDE